MNPSFFDHLFLPVICPLFYIETLADLEKAVRHGRTPEEEVGIIAEKSTGDERRPMPVPLRSRLSKHAWGQRADDRPNTHGGR
jgi:hypothetical protein